jgi:glycosyltransferase involved in cell wall biosynthesis
LRTPSASIIINNYNYGRFVADAIESALAQSHGDIEIIAVDDGSTDDSRQVIDQYCDRITCIFKRQNEGQASAYNAGWAASEGDIVCFLDSDDTLFESTISQAAAMFHDPSVVKVEWQLQIVDRSRRPSGHLVPAKPLPAGNLRELTLSTGPYYDWYSTPPSSGNCYSRGFLRRVMPVPEPPFRHGADVYLTMLAPLYGDVRRLPQPKGTYRVHENNSYYGRPLGAERLADYVRRFEDCCLQLKTHLARQGISADVEEWKKRNFNYLWPTRLLQTFSDLARVLPEGDTYVLVNDNEWGSAEPIRGRHAIPFLEHEGAYWGPPGDDDQAIAQLARLRREKDVAHIVFSWTAYWWLEHYHKFSNWLRTNCKCVLENDRLTVFEFGEITTGKIQ